MASTAPSLLLILPTPSAEGEGPDKRGPGGGAEGSPHTTHPCGRSDLSFLAVHPGRFPLVTLLLSPTTIEEFVKIRDSLVVWKFVQGLREGGHVWAEWMGIC